MYPRKWKYIFIITCTYVRLAGLPHHTSPGPEDMVSSPTHSFTATTSQPTIMAVYVLTDFPLSSTQVSPTLNSSAGFDDGSMSSADFSWPVVLLLPIILCSVVGNLLVCLAIGKDPKLQTFTNFFLFSMAMADLMVALLVMPFGLTKDLLGKSLTHWH